MKDKKPEFLRAMALWINHWEKQKILNCQKFVTSAQTSAAFKQTLNCHASLIKDLLNDGYKFIMTTRFQRDPVERRIGQYRQMSGGRFWVSLKDVLCSERVIKFKSLVKVGIDICNSDVKKTNDQKNILNELLDKPQCTSLNNV